MKNLMFLVMMFGLTVVSIDRTSAQNAASEKSDAKQVYVEIANMTNKAFNVNVGAFGDVASPQDTPPGEIFKKIVPVGQKFRVRQAVTNKTIHWFSLNAAKPIIFIETDNNGSNLKVRELDVVGDKDFKKRSDDAFAALKGKSGSQSGTAASNQEKLDKFKKRLIGTWKGKTGGVRYDQNTLTSFDSRGNKGVTVPYRIVDEKTVEVAITKDFKYSSRETITFKDNGNTIIQYSSISKDTNEYKRVK